MFFNPFLRQKQLLRRRDFESAALVEGSTVFWGGNPSQLVAFVFQILCVALELRPGNLTKIEGIIIRFIYNTVFPD